MNILTTIKNFFSLSNLKGILIVAITLLIAFTLNQGHRISTLTRQVAAAQEQKKIDDRNLEVAKQSAIYWKSKDSQNVVTVGLLSATNATWKTQFADLDTRFNNLILQNDKNVQRQSLLLTQIGIKDSIIASLSRNRVDTGSYVINDSTLLINETKQYDARNYSKLSGNVSLHLDSNKIKLAKLNLQQSFGVGIDLATYRDNKGIPKVSVGSKYPGIQLSVTGIQDVNDQIQAAIDKKKEKSSFGFGLQLGYGYTIVAGQPVKPGLYVGVGVGWQPAFLRFNKK
jgi:hypothetical protein